MVSGSTRILVLVAVVVMVWGAAVQATEPIRIMPVGDSITVGYTNLPGQPEVPFEYGWRSGLYTQLTTAGYSFQYVGSSDQHPTPDASYTGPDLSALGQDYHNGVGGVGTAWVSQNITSWIRDNNPDVILLMIGINDIPQYSTAQPYNAECALNGIVQKAISAKPSAQLIVAQTIPYANYTDAIVQYNDYISNILVPYYSGLGYNVSAVDQYSNFLTDGAIDPALYSNAINHPSPEGYQRMAQTWYDGIEALGEITHTALPVIRTMTDDNLLSDKPAVASSVYNGSFSPSYVTDGTANQQVFFGTADGGGDGDMRLTIHDIDSEDGFDVIRIWRDLNDANRQPARVNIRCSASDTTSLAAESFETELACMLSLDFGMEEYVDILVNAPAGTQSLFLDFGGVDSNGSAYGLRIAEVQAFAMPEPTTMAMLLCSLVYSLRRKVAIRR